MSVPHPLRIGLKLSPQATTIADLRAVWRIADEQGFDHCWNFDHFAGIDAVDPSADVFEAWTLLAAMAEATVRVRIGCLVTGNTYRHPAVLAKMATTVDHLSGGRLEVGIGAAWAELEHTMFGLDFGTRGTRVERLAESVQVLKALWTQERTTFDGDFVHLEDAVASPKPLQTPHPPLWIGGTGRRKTLRVVAAYADVWNAPWGNDPEVVSELSEVVDAHCRDLGRDPSEIRRSVQFRYEDDEGALRLVEDYVGRGLTEIVLMLPPERGVAGAESAAALLPRLRELG